MFKDDKMILLDDSSRREITYQAGEPGAIWEGLTSDDLADFKTLCRSMKNLVFKWPMGIVTNPLAWYMYHFHYRRDGHFISESDWFAKNSNGIISRQQTAMIQRMYTWAHIVGAGCSTSCIWDEETEAMVCMRSLDWAGALELGNATRIYDFKDNNTNHSFTAAGVIGMVGLLTGVKTGYSVAINYLPWGKPSARYKTDPLFMLRMLLEDESIKTYEEAFDHITNCKVGAPACITLCGIEKDQACAIEIGKGSRKHVRKAKNGLLVQTNHYDRTSPFSEQNATMYSYPVRGRKPVLDWHDGGLLQGSGKRRTDLAKAFGALIRSGNDVRESALKAYTQSPTWNYETAQWALMHPKSGEMEVWARRPK